MKKQFLIISGIFAFLPLLAEDSSPTMIHNLGAYQVSIDGKYVIGSSVVGNIENPDLGQIPILGTGIFEISTGIQDQYQGRLETLTGNAVTKDATGIAFQEDGSVPVYLKLGQTIDDPQFYGCEFRAISHLGNRIIGIDKLSTPETPFYVDINPDGTFQPKQKFPLPTVDFFGQSPTRITVNTLNQDGTIVAGYVVAGNNLYTYPIVFTQIGDFWTFYFPSKDLFNPYKIQLPSVPAPVKDPSKNLDDFLTVEQFDRFFQAELDAQKGGVPFPDPRDFMSPDKRAEYEAQLKAYTNYATARDAYLNARDEIIVTSPNFVEARGIALSPDGINLVTNILSPLDYPSGFGSKQSMILFDTDDNSHMVLPGENSNLTPLQITDRRVIIAAPFQPTEAETSYIYFIGEQGFMKIEEYLMLQGYESWISKYGKQGLGRASVDEDIKVIATSRDDQTTLIFDMTSGSHEGTNTNSDSDNIQDILEDSQDIEILYFDLSGRRVVQPSQGIFIVRKGSITTKIYIP